VKFGISLTPATGNVHTNFVFFSICASFVCQLKIVAEARAMHNVGLCHFCTAVGCPNVLTSQHMWVTRHGDELHAGCVTSQVTWTLTCVGNYWHGVSSNCSLGYYTIHSFIRSFTDFNQI